MTKGFIGKFVVSDGRRDEAVAVLQPMLAHVHDEPGTLLYLMHFDPDDANVIWFYERYADEAALKAHQSSAVHDALVPKLRELLTSETTLHWVDFAGGKGLPERA